MTGQTTETIAAFTAVCGLLGGVLRYVLRLAVTVDRAARTGQETVTALREHAAESARAREHMAAEIGEHATRLAVLEAKARR